MILIPICAVLLLLIGLFLIILPPSKGKLPEFKNADGEIIEGSISEKTKIEINGTELGIILLGESAENPVLLFCGGGPGIPQYLLEYLYPSALTKHFTVCYCDYRGTGLSYSKVNPEEMTSEVFLSDTDAVTDYLRDRFNTEKIYIAGHSFGTFVALNAIKNHPEKYHAYLAVSQIVKQDESETLAYDYMLDEYTKNGNTKMVKEMSKYPVHESEDAMNRWRSSSARDKSMHELGVGSARDMKNVITGLFFPSLKCKTYTIPERINIWKGKKNSNRFAVSKETLVFDAVESAKEVEIPVYFFAGEYDYTCCESLQKKYYEALSAPEKKYFFYAGTAHSPIYEDYETTDIILNEILTAQ